MIASLHDCEAGIPWIAPTQDPDDVFDEPEVVIVKSTTPLSVRSETTTTKPTVKPSTKMPTTTSEPTTTKKETERPPVQAVNTATEHPADDPQSQKILEIQKSNSQRVEASTLIPPVTTMEFEGIKSQLQKEAVEEEKYAKLTEVKELKEVDQELSADFGGGRPGGSKNAGGNVSENGQAVLNDTINGTENTTEDPGRISLT